MQTTLGGKVWFNTEDTVKEDQYQSKVGLVVKKGPTAFTDDARQQFDGQNIEVGDWIVFRNTDGWQMIVNETHCRFLQDSHIRMRVDKPDLVF